MTGSWPAPSRELVVWRLTKARYASTAFDGEGARRHGGRWNSLGMRVVYASQSQALALLEQLVHIGDSKVLTSFAMIGATVPEAIVQTIENASLPSAWRSHPPPVELQQLGDRWIRAGATAVLRVPSAICPGEFNYLLRPDHPDFHRIRIGSLQPFALDPRLLDG